jgi:hypothetical protein
MRMKTNRYENENNNQLIFYFETKNNTNLMKREQSIMKLRNLTGRKNPRLITDGLIFWFLSDEYIFIYCYLHLNHLISFHYCKLSLYNKKLCLKHLKKPIFTRLSHCSYFLSPATLQPANLALLIACKQWINAVYAICSAGVFWLWYRVATSKHYLIKENASSIAAMTELQLLLSQPPL